RGGSHVQHRIGGPAGIEAVERLVHVMLDESERGAGIQVRQIVERACEQVIEADDRMALEQKAVAQVRADEARGSGNNDSQKGILRVSIVVFSLAKNGTFSTEPRPSGRGLFERLLNL